jgi:Protein of unknown function (DUF3347)
MKSIILVMVTVSLVTTSCQSQIQNAKTETVKVYGNCGMCETTIEKAANKKKISKADWNDATKMATITYDSNRTTLDAGLKNIALSGYDNQNFLAPDAAYNKLPACCKYNREKKQVAKVMQPAKDTVTIAMGKSGQLNSDMKNAVQETSQLAAVFEHYFSLKDALVKTDGNTAAAKAKALQTVIGTVQMEKLPMDVHTVWMKIVNNLKDDAEHINETKDIAQQRDYFMRLSKSIYELIKVAKPAETVYYQFCPMANDGKGANWLSKENAIKNPYYGKQMLICGSTVEAIKQ